MQPLVARAAEGREIDRIVGAVQDARHDVMHLQMLGCSADLAAIPVPLQKPDGALRGARQCNSVQSEESLSSVVLSPIQDIQHRCELFDALDRAWVGIELHVAYADFHIALELVGDFLGCAHE